MNKKYIFIVALVAVVGISLSALYEAGEFGISGIRTIGSQYTPWDLDRQVTHIDIIVNGIVLGTEPGVETKVSYHDGTDEIEQSKKRPYQMVTIQVDEVIKGSNVGTVVIVKDRISGIVTEEGERIMVNYQDALTYNGGESGIFFIEMIDGVPSMNGYYHFFKDSGDGSLKSGFLNEDTPVNIDSDIRQKALSLRQ